MKDINMQFGSEKVPYVYIEIRKQVLLHEEFSVDVFEFNQLENRESCKFLGQDKDIGVNEVVNKE